MGRKFQDRGEIINGDRFLSGHDVLMAILNDDLCGLNFGLPKLESDRGEFRAPAKSMLAT